MIAGAIALAARMVAGRAVTWECDLAENRQRVFIANHSSHLDFAVLWANLPLAIRERTRPVAARDYWEKGRLRRYMAERVFRAILIDRRTDANSLHDRVAAGRRAIEMLGEALTAGSSLILFPEGTRNLGEGVAEFKSGLYHLCATRPELEVVPVYLENLNRILPKGHVLPVPLLSRVRFGSPIHLAEGEAKSAFLDRCHEAVMKLGER